MDDERKERDTRIKGDKVLDEMASGRSWRPTTFTTTVREVAPPAAIYLITPDLK